MKLYTIEWSLFEESGIHGIYSSIQRANEALVKLRKKNETEKRNRGFLYWVEEYVLDEDPDEDV